MKKHQLITFVTLLGLLAALLVGCQMPAAQTKDPVNDPAPAAPKQTDVPQTITKNEAEQIALQHAGLDAADVIFDRTEFDADDAIPHYEIEFHSGAWEYDYEIHADDGTVIKHHKEQENYLVPATTQPVVSQNQQLTKEQAEQIALDHAGLNAKDVTFERTEYEVDDGIPRYEIEFRSGGWEYDYEIHALTGEVLSWDKDNG